MTTQQLNRMTDHQFYTHMADVSWAIGFLKKSCDGLHESAMNTMFPELIKDYQHAAEIKQRTAMRLQIWQTKKILNRITNI